MGRREVGRGVGDGVGWGGILTCFQPANSTPLAVLAQRAACRDSSSLDPQTYNRLQRGHRI